MSELHIRLNDRDTLSRQIYRQIRAAIYGGRLKQGDVLPPTRELARRLSVSRNTVTLAYEWLIAERLLSGKRSAGTAVNAEPSQNQPPRHGVAIRHRAVWRKVHPPEVRAALRYDFSVGTPDARLFPYDDWRRLLARQIRPAKLATAYADPAGLLKLREAIARYFGAARGVNAAADDVIVTSGAQQAFDLIARVLVDPGDRIALEDPGYAPARLLFESAGARVAPVRVDAEGIDVAAIPRDARLIYITPSHQFPLGMPMSYSRRVALLAWADEHDAVVIEDDYDSEFRFGGRPVDTLQAIDRSGRVIYVGSFSKSLLPSLRLGFLIAPPSLRHAFIAASFVASWYPQWPAQAALATLIDGGLFARHVRKVRHEYASRYERILATLTRDFPSLEPIPSVTGMHLATMLSTGGLRAERALFERAAAAGVAIERLSQYYVSDPRAGVVLGYGGIAGSDIEEGLRRLRQKP